MRRFPSEFEAILTPRGRRILRGDDPACGLLADPSWPFLSMTNVVDVTKAERLRALLDRHLPPHLVRIDTPVPAALLRKQSKNYAETLPKTARVWSAELERRREKSFQVASALGLVDFLRSESLRTFAEVISGRRLRARNGIQLLGYGTGDYAGPHNDHHPEEPAARDGYLDLHVSLANDAVAHQWIVGAPDGHFSRITSVTTPGTVTVYRLPFWHYVTPLAAKPGREADARRWLLLATYLFRR